MVISALVLSIAALAALAVSFGQSQQAREVHQNPLEVRYAAEAGLTWAMEKLWANPNECFSANPDFQLDQDGNPATPPIDVDITPVGPCLPGTPLTAFKVRASRPSNGGSGS